MFIAINVHFIIALTVQSGTSSFAR